MRLLSLIFAAAAVLFAAPASAQDRPRCEPRDAIVDLLTGEPHFEVRLSNGVNRNGFIYEFWVNIDTGTWSITGTETSGLTCILDFGEQWSGREFLLPIGDPA